jgi:hypothetical protein
VEGCREDVPDICMNNRAQHAQPRFWDKIILGRPLPEARAWPVGAHARFSALHCTPWPFTLSLGWPG